MVACGNTGGGSGAGGGAPPGAGGGGNGADAGGGAGAPDAGGIGGGAPDAGAGAPDAGGGGTASDCNGLAPGALPAMVTHQTTDSTASSPNFCALPIGDGRGDVAFNTRSGGHPSWTILSPAGDTEGRFGFFHGDAFPTPIGFIGFGGSSTQQTDVVAAFDPSGKRTGETGVNGTATYAADPRGGLLAVGHFNPGSAPSQPPANAAIEMFNVDASIRWGPVALGSNAPVFGAGIDLLGHTLVILSGGPGVVNGIWFDEHGAPMTAFFPLVEGFQPGPSTWFETSPLIGSGLALRRMDAPSPSATEERRTSSWMGVVPSGTPRLDPPPAWLGQRPNTNMQLVRAGGAYAFFPWAADVPSCDQQVEVVSPAGNSCGKLDFPVDANACTTRELRLGLDGTVAQMLPQSREQNTPPGSPVRTCTLRFWPAALR
ncbi:MAG TPA: hypothetical protein VI356_03580 [Myxococcales bacterium]